MSPENGRGSDGKEIIGLSDLMEEVKTVYAPTNSRVLITGETGTGKELIARELHKYSPRRNGPFVAINCTALPEGLIESELFGHERGAFTDAVADKQGLFVEADRGTLFIDEIGDLTKTIQAKLLRVLEEEEVRPVGGTQTTHVDVRVITATNRDLTAAVREKRFRDDLYYRLAVLSIHLPPLRERIQDIEPLVRFFIKRYGNIRTEGLPIVTDISQDALDCLRIYRWPGNIRELENVIERACLLCHGNKIKENDLPNHIQIAHIERIGEGTDDVNMTRVMIAALGLYISTNNVNALAATIKACGGLKTVTARLEKDIALEVVKACGGRVSEAAQLLGISRRILKYLLDKV